MASFSVHLRVLDKDTKTKFTHFNIEKVPKFETPDEVKSFLLDNHPEKIKPATTIDFRLGYFVQGRGNRKYDIVDRSTLQQPNDLATSAHLKLSLYADPHVTERTSSKKTQRRKEGRRHDSGMLADSGLLQQLNQFAFSTAGNPMCLYGDPAYPLRVHLQAPFKNANITQQMHEFNASMSSVRESVEWLFGDIVNYFKFLDFKKNLKLQLNAVGKFYIVAAILRNALTCMYPNETSQFFGLEPPTLQEYFS